jgi:hypothetical protein
LLSYAFPGPGKSLNKEGTPRTGIKMIPDFQRRYILNFFLRDRDQMALDEYARLEVA